MKNLNTLFTKPVFVDSSAFFALFHDGDSDHGEAVGVYDLLAKMGATLITTDSIIAETHQLMVRRLGHHVARQWLYDLEQSYEINILFPDEHMFNGGKDIILSFGDKDFSLTDAISFTVMKEFSTKYAFAYDKHFGQYGFTALNSNFLLTSQN